VATGRLSDGGGARPRGTPASAANTRSAARVVLLDAPPSWPVCVTLCKNLKVVDQQQLGFTMHVTGLEKLGFKEVLGF